MNMSKKYWIYRVGDGPDPLGDAKLFDETSTAPWPETALDLYLEECDKNSHFIDGYPEGEEYAVVDCQSGEEFIYKVYTEFEPSFYMISKETL